VNDSIMITAKEIAELLQCSVSKGYAIINQCNEELKAMGKLTLRGKTNRRYFMQKVGVTNE
jgi:hypothetical protein